MICSDYEQSKYFYTEVLDRQAVCVLQRPRRTAKQKPDKEKKVKNQNADRAKKLGIQYVPKM